MPGEQQFQTAMGTIDNLVKALPESASDYHPDRWDDVAKYAKLLTDDMTAFIGAVTGKSTTLEKVGQDLHDMAEDLEKKAEAYAAKMHQIEDIIGDAGALASFRSAVKLFPEHWKKVGEDNGTIMKAKRRRFIFG
jgi:hypothetical protein